MQIAPQLNYPACRHIFLKFFHVPVDVSVTKLCATILKGSPPNFQYCFSHFLMSSPPAALKITFMMLTENFTLSFFFFWCYYSILFESFLLLGSPKFNPLPILTELTVSLLVRVIIMNEMKFIGDLTLFEKRKRQQTRLL